VKLPLPRQEYEILLCHVYQITPTELYAHPERYLPALPAGRQAARHGETENQNLQQLIERRLKNEPIAYLVGYQPFLGLKFFVDRSVLIPRPETEILAQLAIDLKPKTVADIGTGSGAIAVSIAKNLPETKVIGIDSSPAALKIASKNAEYHQVADHCHFIKGHLLDPIPEKLDLIVSNPPYIPTREIENLEPQIRNFEPRPALDGGEDGLHYIRQLIEKSPGHLNPNGLLLMEIGSGQSEKVAGLARQHFMQVEMLKDLAGIDRILKASVLK